jgi:hypothetical protein
MPMLIWPMADTSNWIAAVPVGQGGAVTFDIRYNVGLINIDKTGKQSHPGNNDVGATVGACKRPARGQSWDGSGVELLWYYAVDHGQSDAV